MVYISSINLWCNKNLVDTQFLLWKVFGIEGIEYHPDPYAEETDIVFLNTCGFLSSGRAEAMETIEKLLEAGKKIFIVGCALIYFQKLVIDQDNSEELKRRQEIIKNPNISFVGWKDFDKFTKEDLENGYRSSNLDYLLYDPDVRMYTNTHQGFEYLKIAEGCNKQCSFCIIPKIRGKQKSLPIEKILEQAQSMIDEWVSEIVLIAQDITTYGIDIYGEFKLLELLKELDKLEGDFSYRLLYFYLDGLTFDIVKELTKLEKFIPYFDIPLQHISQNVLKDMRRFSDIDKIKWFLYYIREQFDSVYIRTNFIVGFPGETEENVTELAEFISEGWFDNVAFFEYHDEPLAPSSVLLNKLTDSEIHERFEYLKWYADDIYTYKQELRKEETQYGYIMDREGEWTDIKLIVRSWLHAPEIDEYDSIGLEQIKWIYNESGEIDLGVKIEYTLK